MASTPATAAAAASDAVIAAVAAAAAAFCAGVRSGASICGPSLPLWVQPYMTADRATIETAAIKVRVSFVFFMAPRLSSF